MITPAQREAAIKALEEQTEGASEAAKVDAILAAIEAAAPVEEPEPEPAPEFDDPGPEKITDALHVLENPGDYPDRTIRWAKFVLAFHRVAEPIPPSDPVDETPTPTPTPTPVPTGTLIANQAELTKALQAASGGEVFTLAPGSYRLNCSKAYTSPVTLDCTEATFTGGHAISAKNLTVKGGVFKGWANAAKGPMLTVSNSDGLTFDGVDFAGVDNSGWGIFGRNVKNLTVKNGQVHNLRDGVIIWTGQNIVVDDNSFFKMGSDCFDPSNVDGVYFRRNKIRDAWHEKGAHPDIVQLGTAPCRNVYIEDNDSDAVTMGYDDFGCNGPNLNVNIRRNHIRTNDYENAIVIEQGGTTGEVIDNVIITGVPTKKPRFVVPSSMTKRGNTIDGKPV